MDQTIPLPLACPDCAARMPETAGFCPGCGRSMQAAQRAQGRVGIFHENIAGALAYFPFIPATVFLFVAPYNKNRFVRFHALQSLLFFGIINVLDIAIISFESIRWLRIPSPYISGFGVLFFIFINMVACIGWLVGIVQAARGKYYRLPFVGDIAAQCLHQEATVK